MDRRNSNHFNMIEAVLHFCLERVTETDVIPQFSIALDRIKNKAAEIRKCEEIIIDGTTGVTMAMNRVRENMSVLSTKCASSVLAYAHDVNEYEIIAALHYSLAKMRKMKKTDLTSACNTVVDYAEANLRNAAPYGLVENDVTNLKLIVADYSLRSESPRITIVARSLAVSKIKENIDEIIHNILETQMDLMVKSLVTTNPSFVSSYFGARQVLNLGKTITKLTGVITDESGTPVSGIPVVITKHTGNTTYTSVTNFNGEYNIYHILAGDYMVNIAANGYQPIIENGVHFAPGKEVGKNYRLIAVG